MSTPVKQSDVNDLAAVMFGIGVEAGRDLLKQLDDDRNIAAAKQLELTTEGRTYPHRQAHDE